MLLYFLPEMERNGADDFVRFKGIETMGVLNERKAGILFCVRIKPVSSDAKISIVVRILKQVDSRMRSA